MTGSGSQSAIEDHEELTLQVLRGWASDRSVRHSPIRLCFDRVNFIQRLIANAPKRCICELNVALRLSHQELVSLNRLVQQRRADAFW